MGLSFNVSTSGRPTGVAGRIGLTLFFSIFAAVGSMFTMFGVREVIHVSQMRSWPARPCEILESRVDDVNDGYRFAVRYRYQAGDGVEAVWRESNILRRGGAGKEDNYADAQKLANRYPAGGRASCYVNPRDADSAVLEKSSLAGAVFIIPFSLIFVTIGFGGIWFAWSRKSSTETGPISSARRTTDPRRIGAVVCGVFFIIGVVATYFFTIRGFIRVQQSRQWTPTPCVVVSSRVQSHSGDDGTTYSVDVLYEYEVDGHSHRANRYDLMGGSSSGYEGKAEIIRQYPTGRKTICYVNPTNPGDAVLFRGFRPIMLVGLIPLVFCVVGGVGFYNMMRGNKPRLPADTGPVELKAAASPAAKVVGMLLVALFWNGIVSVFVTLAVKGWQRGHPDYFLTVFMIPFVLVGLALIGGVVYFALAALNPRPRLTVSALSMPLGGSISLEWRWTGRVSVIERMNLFLEGREEATYQRGTTTTTDKEVFVTVPISETTHAMQIEQGRTTVMVPPDAMHSFKAEHNKIVWMLRVKSIIPRWPDVDEEYEITVTPS